MGTLHVTTLTPYHAQVALPPPCRLRRTSQRTGGGKGGLLEPDERAGATWKAGAGCTR